MSDRDDKNYITVRISSMSNTHHRDFNIFTFLFFAIAVAVVGFAIFMTTLDGNSNSIAKDYLMSSEAHNPENFVGSEDSFAVNLPRPIVYNNKRRSVYHTFACDDTLRDITREEETALLGFYKTCETITNMVMAPADPEAVDAARSAVADLVRDPEDRVQTMSGDFICKTVNGRPFPLSGQPVPNFLKNKALCTAYIESL